MPMHIFNNNTQPLRLGSVSLARLAAELGSRDYAVQLLQTLIEAAKPAVSSRLNFILLLQS